MRIRYPIDAERCDHEADDVSRTIFPRDDSCGNVRLRARWVSGRFRKCAFIVHVFVMHIHIHTHARICICTLVRIAAGFAFPIDWRAVIHYQHDIYFHRQHRGRKYPDRKSNYRIKSIALRLFNGYCRVMSGFTRAVS